MRYSHIFYVFFEAHTLLAPCFLNSLLLIEAIGLSSSVAARWNARSELGKGRIIASSHWSIITTRAIRLKVRLKLTS